MFPRTGWYNITVAGAAGGRGLCNPEKGKGVVTSGRLYVEKGVNDSVLVMVGQQGRGPCDVNSTHPLCLLDVSNTTSAAECYSKWVNQTTYLIRVYTGGGSGGGASMLWPPDSSGRYGTNRSSPYVVSGGGGGTSVQLNYTAFVLPPNHTAEEYYRININGKYEFAGDTNRTGSLGSRPNGDTPPAAGAGGGYLHEGDEVLIVNGKSISQPHIFAKGGGDCAFMFTQSDVPFKNVYGGFGGGGGGCSGGGGGGGYTGGSIIFLDFSGEGGFSHQDSALEDTMELPLNDGDGYVDIVPSDCGCAEQCVLDTAEEMFDCTCVSPFSNLAPDGFDCYEGKLSCLSLPHVYSTTSLQNCLCTCVYTEELLLELIQESSTNITLSDDYPNTPIIASLYILPTPVTLYSMDFTMTIQDLEEERVAGKCALIWLSTDLTSVLTTNIVTRYNKYRYI